MEWCEAPPTSAQNPKRWSDRFALLSNRPGVWARWSYASSQAALARELDEDDDYEVVACEVDGVHYIYARSVRGFTSETSPAAGEPGADTATAKGVPRRRSADSGGSGPVGDGDRVEPGVDTDPAPLDVVG